MNICKEVFGKYAFRKYNKDYRRGPINKAIFEMWAICFEGLDFGQLEKIKINKKEFLEGFGNLLSVPEFSVALKAGDPYSYNKRIEMCNQLIKEYI